MEDWDLYAAHPCVATRREAWRGVASHRAARRGVAWRGVAWSGVASRRVASRRVALLGVASRSAAAWRGVDRQAGRQTDKFCVGPDRQTDRLRLADTCRTPPAAGSANSRAGAAKDSGALRRATASTGKAPHYHDVSRMIMMICGPQTNRHTSRRRADSDTTNQCPSPSS
jgi:hypothetical protein